MSINSTLDAPTTANQSSWSRLVASPEWRRLRLQQRIYVTEMLNHGDTLAATQKAYPEANEKSQNCMSYELAKKPRIVAALDFWKNLNPEKNLLAEVCAALQKTRPGTVTFQRLLMQKERLLLGIKTEQREIHEIPVPPAKRGRPRKVQPVPTPIATNPMSRVPAGSTPLVDAQGTIKGYRTPEGTYVQLMDIVEVAHE